MDLERSLRDELQLLLEKDFHVRQLEKVSHPLTGRVLEVDVLAIPRVQANSSFAFAFEVKLPERLDGPPGVGDAIAQASSYVLCRSTWGCRIIRSFIYPAPEWAFTPHHPLCASSSTWNAYLGGMAHGAGALGVGFARKRNGLQVSLRGEPICNANRWRAGHAPNSELSKLAFQVGSLRIPFSEFP